MIDTISKYYSKLAEKQLIKRNAEKMSNFQKIMKNEDSIYPWNKALLDERLLLERGLIDSHWFDFQICMKREFEENVNEFLRQKTFLKTISGSPLPMIGKQSRYYFRTIKWRYPKDELKRYLIDDYIGRPYISSLQYKSTSLRMQHLYQVELFRKLTCVNLFLVSSRIIEFGGGYGDLANLVFGNNSNNPTYIVIDLPILSKIQFLYLDSIYKGKVFLFSNSNETIKDNAINIIPLNVIDAIDSNIGIFWATYSLTETNFNVLDILRKKKFFGSDRYFVAYQSKNSMFENGPRMANELKSYLHLNDFSDGFENGNYLYL